MVVRSSEVKLSKYDDIRMDTVKDNTREYIFARQDIDRKKPVPFGRYVFTPIGNT